jgi:Niemann-Pick C1 protein
MQSFLGDSLGGALTRPWVKCAVIAAAAALAAGGFAGCAMMKVDADVNDFIPPGSYLKDWFADADALFLKLGAGISVYSRDTAVHTAEGAALMLAASAAFKGDAYVSSKSVSSWIEDFNAHRNSSGAFTLIELHAWVSGDGASFRSDVVWKNETNDVPNEGVVSTRMRGNHIKSSDSAGKVDSMNSLRNSIKGRGLHSFTFQLNVSAFCG